MSKFEFNGIPLSEPCPDCGGQGFGCFECDDRGWVPNSAGHELLSYFMVFLEYRDKRIGEIEKRLKQLEAQS